MVLFILIIYRLVYLTMKKISLLFLLLFIVACNESATGSTTRIAVIGDSISDGVNPQTAPAKHGWVQMIASGGEKYTTLRGIWADAEVRNYSISGSTAAQWNSDSYLSGSISAIPQVAVVCLGGNDVLHAINSGGFDQTAATALSNNITGIVVKLKTALTNLKVVLIGYYDLFDNRSSALSGQPGFTQYSGMSAYARIGNTIISNIALVQGATFVPILEAFHDHAYGADLGGSGIAPDYFRRPISAFDIHPVTEGHRKLADLVLEKFAGITF